MSRLPLPILIAATFIAAPAWAASTPAALDKTVNAISPANLASTTLATISLTTISATIVSATIMTSSSMVSGTSPENLPPLLVGNEPRTLDATINLAANHPQTATSLARVSEAKGAVQSARASRWFTLSGDAEAGGQFFNDQDADGTAGVGDLGLSLNQPLIDGGRRRGAVTSAEERFAGATDNYEWQKRLRRYTAVQAHVNLWLAQQLAQNNADNLNQLEQIATEVHGRLQQGEATVTEVAESESRLASARSAQADRMASLGNAQASYLRDVGESVNIVADPGIGIPAGTESTTPHPLIAAAQHAVTEAEGMIRQRDSGYWPTLDLRSRVSQNAFSGTSRTDDATQGQVTLNLGYTFIDHGVVAGETAAARAARKAAESDLANTRLEVEAARLNAQSTLTEADRRLSESERAEAESAKVIKNLMQEVKQGNRTLRDLLDARRDELAAANAWAQAYASRTLATYDLERWQ